jgi:hypothetical protein
MSMIVRDMINDAAAPLGQYAADRPLNNVKAQLMLRRMQRMLDLWSTDGLYVYNVTTVSLALAPNVASYSTTLFSGGRPTAIDSVFVNVGGVSGIDYSPSPMTQMQYDAIPYKIAAGIPAGWYYDPTFPDGTLYFYPVPYQVMTARVNTRTLLANASLTLDSTISLPPGYDAAIVDNLSLNCSGIFGPSSRCPPEIAQAAKDALTMLQRLNSVPGIMETGLERKLSPDAFIYKAF